MSLFVLCDTHLSSELDKPMDVFGGRWNNFEQKLETRWNEAVTENDTVIVGGDISWAMNLPEAKKDFEFLHSLPGKKILVRGNHDYWWTSLKKMNTFLEENEFNSISFLQNDALLIGNTAICGTRGWFADQKAAPKDTDYEKISVRESQRLEMSLDFAAKNMPDAQPTVFLHLPPVFANQVCEPICDILTKRKVKRCYYGHIHGVYDIPPCEEYNGVLYILASSDYLDFVPLRVD